MTARTWPSRPHKTGMNGSCQTSARRARRSAEPSKTGHGSRERNTRAQPRSLSLSRSSNGWPEPPQWAPEIWRPSPRWAHDPRPRCGEQRSDCRLARTTYPTGRIPSEHRRYLVARIAGRQWQACRAGPNHSTNEWPSPRALRLQRSGSRRLRLPTGSQKRSAGRPFRKSCRRHGCRGART